MVPQKNQDLNILIFLLGAQQSDPKMQINARCISNDSEMINVDLKCDE